MLDRTKRSIYTIAQDVNPAYDGTILTVDYNPEAAEQYQLYCSLGGKLGKDAGVFTTRFTLKKEHLQTVQKEFIYSRNKRLLENINILAGEYDKTPEGLPFYLVAPYLFFSKHAIVAVSNNNTAWVRYDHINRTLKFKSFFSGKYYEVVEAPDLISLYGTPIHSNILETSIHIEKLFEEDLDNPGFTNFPVTYHIYKP